MRYMSYYLMLELGSNLTLTIALKTVAGFTKDLTTVEYV
jgi:hypothetical protein